MALDGQDRGHPLACLRGLPAGTRQGDRWSVKASNMHAWPELYFQGYGWVRFEPTAAVASAPAWSVENPDSVPSSSASPSAGTSVPSSSPSASASPVDLLEPRARRHLVDRLVDPWNIIWRIAAAVLVVLALCLAPMTVRAARRRRRMSQMIPPSWWPGRGARCTTRGPITVWSGPPAALVSSSMRPPDSSAIRRRCSAPPGDGRGEGPLRPVPRRVG
ncbi:hypothetical protein BWX38_16685 [Acidipropionibacterium acidipropionici]|nr:hypothetical protein BWX38_16685 [Acidipropionibacterium acidipropionici]